MTPRVALLVIGDGRDALRNETLESFAEQVQGDVIISTIVEVDDRAHDLGFCGAIRAGWERLRAVNTTKPFDYVFHLEEDWTFNRVVMLDRLIAVLDCRPDVAQVALRRGPENELERRAGGLIELWPDEYTEHVLTRTDFAGEPDRMLPYLEHRLFFTTNPCVYRRDLIERYDWPEAPACEEAFGRTLHAEGCSFAFWGTRQDEPWVTHTGRYRRAGGGY